MTGIYIHIHICMATLQRARPSNKCPDLSILFKACKKTCSYFLPISALLQKFILFKMAPFRF